MFEYFSLWQGASCIRKDDEVSITLRIQFSGDGATAKVIGEYKAGIEGYWSGNFGNLNVTTKALIVDEGPRFRITVTSGRGRSYMNGVGALTGQWFTETASLGWVAAHEMGHGMGLPDRYSYTTNLSHLGFENNIMGRYGQPARVQDILDIIRINQ